MIIIDADYWVAIVERASTRANFLSAAHVHSIDLQIWIDIMRMSMRKIKGLSAIILNVPDFTNRSLGRITTETI